VRSCQTQVQAAADAAITTLEGLSADGSHPVQIAWQELDVPQCGYCQAGQMMSAAALLATIAKGWHRRLRDVGQANGLTAVVFSHRSPVNQASDRRLMTTCPFSLPLQ